MIVFNDIIHNPLADVLYKNSITYLKIKYFCANFIYQLKDISFNTKLNMTIDTRELLDAVGALAEEQNVRVTIKHSAKGAVIGGAAIFAGGMLLGPIGLLIGGTAGGALAYYNSKGWLPYNNTFLKVNFYELQNFF